MFQTRGFDSFSWFRREYGHGRGRAGRGESNPAEQTVIANSTDTDPSETRPVQENRRRKDAPGPYHPPSDDESHLSDASGMDIRLSLPVPSFPLGAGGSRFGGKEVHLP